MHHRFNQSELGMATVLTTFRMINKHSVRFMLCEHQPGCLDPSHSLIPAPSRNIPPLAIKQWPTCALPKYDF